MTASLPFPPPREAVERVYGLSPLQAGMLFHDLMSPQASPYFRQLRFALEGEVDPELCEATWNELLARHALLRSVFDHERTAQPVQIVLKRQTVEFHFATATQSDVADWLAADRRRGFDLRRDRLMRIALFRLGPSRYEMTWSHPHILLDGWSGAILSAEFVQLYAARRRGGGADPPPAPDPDAFLAARAARDGASARAHWSARLEGYAELATLPRLARAAAPARHVERRFRIAAAETDRLRALAATQAASFGTLLQALWGLLLGRWTGRRDVAFGIVVSGRSVAAPDVERVVGMFINTIPVRVRWDVDDRLGDLLRRLQEQSDADAAHDHAALAEIQAASAAPDGLLDHLLVLENYPVAALDPAAAGFTVAPLAAEERANYDFGVIAHVDRELEIALPHDAARFPSDLMQRMERYWRVLIARALADPDRRLSELDAMPDEERRALVGFGRGPCHARPAAATLADLWREQVDRTPDADALAAGAERLSYRALDEAAEGVAQRLRDAGVGVGSVCGVLCSRSAARIAALLGVMKAGAAYLPLSPSLPDARIAFLVDDARCEIVLADPANAARLDALRPGRSMPIAGAGAPPGRCPAAAHDIAYIIYTSGSTGDPKGVAIEHAGFLNMILAQIRDFDVRPDDRVAQFASCSFDASMSEIFMALLRGACLVMASEQEIRDGGGFLALLEAERVTVATLPPSYLSALDGAELPGLRVLITAGEPPDPEDCRRLARRMAVFNAYGPTEASVCASWHRVDARDAYAAGVPIGRPIANTGMAVCDPEGRLTPLDAVGELCLTGAGLSRGYLGRPALTQERFPVRDGERLYRTGDAALMRADGETLVLGRLDGQVKINGHRIELGEIEQRLRANAAVAQAAAAVAGDPPRIVAFVVPRGPLDPAALRAELAAVLPSWMTPAAIAPVERLPLTLAGKIDRRALAATQTPADGGPAPLGPIETAVAEAFAAVLGSGPYGRDSSFRAAGGDSLRAIRLLGRLRRGGFALAMQELIAADTVAAIARAAQRDTACDEPAPTGPVPLTPAQHWCFAHDRLGAARFNHLVLLSAGRALDGAAVAAAFDAIHRHHDALRMVFRRNGAGWIGHALAPDASFRGRAVDLRAAADPRPAIRADALSHQPPPAGEGRPLFQATHYQTAEGDYLLLGAHHLVIDAISWRVVIEDLETALRQAAAGGAIRLPRKTTSYRDHACALASPDGLAAAERERAFWQRLAAAPAAPAPRVAAHDYGDVRFAAADLGPVDPAAPDRRVLAMLLARLGAALRRLDGRAAMRVLVAHHGRDSRADGQDFSRTAGWFTADYPFWLDCRASARDVEAALAQTPSNGIGWGVLRWLSGRPVELAEPELYVNYLGAVDPSPESDFRIADLFPAVSVERLARTRLIEIEARVEFGRLRASLIYPPSGLPLGWIDALVLALGADDRAAPAA